LSTKFYAKRSILIWVIIGNFGSL